MRINNVLRTYPQSIDVLNKIQKVSESMKIKKCLTEKEIQEEIRKVDGAMAQAGMPLTEEIKKKLYNCLTNKSTFEIERQKIIKKYKRIYK